jgi:hypothetical protein
MLTLATVLSYVLIHGSTNVMMTGGNVKLPAALATRSEYGGEFLWFRTRDGAYLIRDARMLERIDHLFDGARALDPDVERVRVKLQPLEKRESELDREIDALDEDGRDKERARDLERDMRDVEAQLRVLEREEEEVDRRRDAREAEAERRMFPILADAIHSGVAQPVRQ